MITTVSKAIALTLLSAALSSTPSSGDSATLSNTIQRSFAAASVQKLDLDMGIASVHIFSDSESAVTVAVVRRFKGLSPTADDKTWISGSGLVVAQSGDSVIVRDHTKGVYNDIDIHESGREQTVEIHLPPSIAVQLDTGVGAVNVVGPIKALNGNLGAGKVNLHDAGTDSYPNATKFELGVGKLNASWTRPVSGGILLDNGMGDINVTLPASQKATVKGSSGLGNVSIHFPGASVDQSGDSMSGDAKATLNGGGDTIKLSTGVGKVTLGATGN